MGKKSHEPSPASLVFCHTIAILLATFALYHGAFDNPLFGDSKNTVTPEILAGPIDILTIFGKRGVSFISFPALQLLFGADLYGQHVANVLLHAAVSIIIYVFARTLYGIFGQDSTPRDHARLALVSALIFAAHPVAVYAVGYLIQRSIVMTTMFALIASILWLEGLKRNRVAWYLASVIAYFLAIHSKEHAVMLPGVFLAMALAYWHAHGIPWRDGIRSILPSLALCALIAVEITLRTDTTLTTGVVESNLTDLLPVAQNLVPELSQSRIYGLSILSQSWHYFAYLLTCLIPWAMPLGLEIPAVFPASFWHWPQSLGPLLYAGYGIAAVRIARRKMEVALPLALVIAPWLLFFTEFTTVRLSEQFVIYRAYLWMAFLVPLAPWFLRRILPTTIKSMTPVFLIPLCLLLAAKSLERLKTFDSEVALWRDALRITPASPEVSYKLYRTHFYLANALEHEAARSGDSGQILEAAEHYRKTLALNPAHVPSLVNLAGIHLREHDPDGAEPLLGKALRIEPHNATVHVAIGALHDARGWTEEALEEYLIALKFDPDMAMAHINAGGALKRLGRIDAAIAHFEAVVSTYPDNTEARKKLEMLLAE